ncbi:META domain-containing protein [Flavitalea sp. BT771]|uniref:META domain-containing protein n=1 Tax=Flavitalea sp. BT771 TaxID=3063329 RepID=UPI0026E46B83|nr:META domain-containing protein [Flavitalea sp. BT771]MDO6433411.1 META domain-containing protein [Flavitalea sp. BT771]MDV6222684.1 META domain-containing protein [Flavitalea sp. BT771]
MFKLMIAACLTLLLACQQPDTKNTTKDSATAAALSAPKVTQAPDTTVLDGPWFLQPVLPSDTAAGKRATLRLDLKKGRFAGNTGCNNMSGKFWYSATDSSLTFSDKLVTTKMACTGFNEKAFLKNLLLTTHYKLRNGVLTFLAEDKTELSRWERKPSAPANTSKA